MKKVLVTGAAGTVGLQVIRFLLSEGKYEITALELKNKHNYSRLRPFRKRINIVYGDISDNTIVDALVKSHDVVIHLAGVIPSLANYREEFCKLIDYEGTKTIVDAIKNYNPTCFLLYASSTSVYGTCEDYENITVKSNCVPDNSDYYSKYKLLCEEYIKDNLKNYSIFRLAYILDDPRQNTLIYNMKPDNRLEFLSAYDAGYAFVCAIDFLKNVNKKTFNVSGGEKFRFSYKDHVLNILKNYGISYRYLSSLIFAEKNYYGGYYADGNNLEKILHFRSKNINVYYQSIKKYKNSLARLLPRIFAIPFIAVIKRKKKIEKA